MRTHTPTVGVQKLHHSFDLDWAFFCIPRDKGTCRVGFLQILSTCSLKVSLESMVMPKY